MKRPVIALALFLLSTSATADRYGMAEAMDELGPISSGVFVLLFVGLFMYVLYRESKHHGEIARARFENRQLQEELRALRSAQPRPEEDAAACARDYRALQGFVQDYCDGTIAEHDFFAAVSSHVFVNHDADTVRETRSQKSTSASPRRMPQRTDETADFYRKDKEKNRPNESAYFRRFPLEEAEMESSASAGKLLADIGLAEQTYQAIHAAKEAIFAEHFNSGQRIDWDRFPEEVLHRAAHPVK